MESEQTNLKLKVEEDRKVAMRQIADGFDQAIGKIVQTVSTASSELELSAGSLTTTAEVTPGALGDGYVRIRTILCECAICGRCIRGNGLIGFGNRPPRRPRKSAAQGATQVASNIVDVNHGAADTGAASTHVHGLARSRSGQSNHLRKEVEKFLSTIRAA